MSMIPCVMDGTVKGRILWVYYDISTACRQGDTSVVIGEGGVVPFTRSRVRLLTLLQKILSMFLARSRVTAWLCATLGPRWAFAKWAA